MNRYAELIVLYLDGQATPDEQQELFEALSRDPELQRQFQQTLQISRAIEAERLTTAAPPEVKDAVFAAVGIVPTESLLRRALPFVGMFGSIAAIAIGLALWNSEPAPPAPPRASVSSPAAPSVTAASVHYSRTPTQAAPVMHSHAQRPEPRSDEIPTTPAAVDDDDSFFAYRTTAVTTASPVLRTAHSRIGMISAPTVWSAPSSPEAPLSAVVSYRGSLLASSGAAATAQNFSIAAFYRFDQNNRLGIEFRRAPYTLNIAQPRTTLTTVTLSSLAVAYMFSEPDVRILGGIPFVQPAIGITELGPLATLSAGVSFPVTNDFRFNVGLDGSALVYSSQVASSLSVTIGFSAGLPIR